MPGHRRKKIRPQVYETWKRKGTRTMKVYHKRRGNTRGFRWLRIPFGLLLSAAILGTAGDIECGFISVRDGAVTLAVLLAGLAAVLAWPGGQGETQH